MATVATYPEIVKQVIREHASHKPSVGDIRVEIRIQHDGTEGGVAMQFVEAGIPREHIVLAFHHPNRRPLTDFATG